MTPAQLDLTIVKGKTFTKAIRLGQPRFNYSMIQSVTKAAPAVITTLAPHGLPEGWPYRVEGALGMTDINSALGDEGAAFSDLLALSHYRATVLSPTTLELNEVNSIGFSTYTGSGVIKYNTPMDLTGYSAAMHIRSGYESATPLFTLTQANSRLVVAPTLAEVTMQILAVDTAALTWDTGVYDLELTSPSGVVIAPIYGTVTVEAEVTR